MIDLIDKQLAIDALRICYDTETVTMDNGDEYINYEDAVGEIEQLPSVQPERLKGRWIESHEHAYIDNGVKEWINWYCSECDAPNSDPTDFCPNCGAVMKEGEQE